MKQGTVSVLVGCHSPIHSLIVLVTWIKLYKTFPSWWQIVCIFLHDIGHWGKNYLDNYEEKKQHSLLGARTAKLLFGQKGYDLIVGHCLYNETTKSKLHDPDKHSWLIAPVWWMVTNTWWEPKLQRKNSSRKESAIMFKEAMKTNITNGYEKLGHEIYMEQWGHYNEPNQENLE